MLRLDDFAKLNMVISVFNKLHEYSLQN